MASKLYTYIEYRFDKSQPWREYERTQVPSAVDRYYANALRELPGAEVRTRKERRT